MAEGDLGWIRSSGTGSIVQSEKHTVNKGAHPRRGLEEGWTQRVGAGGVISCCAEGGPVTVSLEAEAEELRAR